MSGHKAAPLLSAKKAKKLAAEGEALRKKLQPSLAKMRGEGPSVLSANRTLMAQQMILARLIGLDPEAPFESIKMAVNALRAPRTKPPEYSILFETVKAVDAALNSKTTGVLKTTLNKRILQNALSKCRGALNCVAQPSISERIRGKQRQGEFHQIEVYVAAEEVVKAWEKAKSSAKGVNIQSSRDFGEKLGRALEDLARLDPEVIVMVSRSVFKED